MKHRKRQLKTLFDNDPLVQAALSQFSHVLRINTPIATILYTATIDQIVKNEQDVGHQNTIKLLVCFQGSVLGRYVCSEHVANSNIANSTSSESGVKTPGKFKLMETVNRQLEPKNKQIYSVTRLDLGIFCDPTGRTVTFLERRKLQTNVDQKIFDNSKH